MRYVTFLINALNAEQGSARVWMQTRASGQNQFLYK